MMALIPLLCHPQYWNRILHETLVAPKNLSKKRLPPLELTFLLPKIRKPLQTIRRRCSTLHLIDLLSSRGYVQIQKKKVYACVYFQLTNEQSFVWYFLS
jgi:hypothetical protein